MVEFMTSAKTVHDSVTIPSALCSNTEHKYTY